jgi:hypothetical protein
LGTLIKDGLAIIIAYPLLGIEDDCGKALGLLFLFVNVHPEIFTVLLVGLKSSIHSAEFDA